MICCRLLPFIGLALAGLASAACAGMPSPLPDDLPTRLRLHDSAAERLTAISFFLGGVFLSALAVNLLWNYLQRDFTWLPRLTMLKSLALVLLWGLLFVIVLTMISGARELMTPGAWRKQGFTYKLADAPQSEPSTATARATPAANDRRKRLAELRTALWLWVGAHEGRLPLSIEESGIPEKKWVCDFETNTLLIYRPGPTLSGPAEVLVYEPVQAGGTRLGLRSDGEIVELTAEEVAQLDQERQP